MTDLCGICARYSEKSVSSMDIIPEYYGASGDMPTCDICEENNASLTTNDE